VRRWVCGTVAAHLDALDGESRELYRLLALQALQALRALRALRAVRAVRLAEVAGTDVGEVRRVLLGEQRTENREPREADPDSDSID
jgi:hypothetical protein